MGKVWVLDTETKGTGANVRPLEETPAEPARKPVPRKPKPRRRSGPPAKAAKRAETKPVETSSSPLPPGHVRKKGTGEIGRVQSIDPKAGTATVLWLKRGGASTVPLSAISRR
jgi:hypothetical protein